MNAIGNNCDELYYSRTELEKIDQDAVEQFGIPSIVLMENAAKNASAIILDHTTNENWTDTVILCGRGNNGGDGYAVARHLFNAGCHVRILRFGEPNSKEAKTNASICAAMKIQVSEWDEEQYSKASLCIDAIFGIGLDRTVQGEYASAIKCCNTSNIHCISLDIPSGLDCDSGKPLGCCIQANLTITFFGKKLGFQNQSAKQFIGEVFVADIGCPQNIAEHSRNPSR
jgi:NAD(P)H-hydrate epimerase